jgi:hypothetical protein
MKTPAALLDILYAIGVAQLNRIDSVSPAPHVDDSLDEFGVASVNFR